MVHAPAAEHEFVDNGYGVQRRDVMYNDFVIVGPAEDAANLSKRRDKVLFFVIDLPLLREIRSHLQHLAIYE